MQTGYNGSTCFSVEPYNGLTHRFDSLMVTVFDRYGNSTILNGLHSDSKGGRNDLKRWAWMISIKKGKKTWSTQALLPNHEFEKKKAEQPGPAQPATQPADKPPVKDQPSPPTSKVSPR